MSGEPKKKLPNEKQLEAAVVDVVYEFKMFRSGWKRLDLGSPALGNNDSTAATKFWSTAPSQTEQKSRTDFRSVEGLLIHFRNLLEFFYEKKTHSGLVLAQHYTGKPSKEMPDWASVYQRRCNELLAHITYRRIHHRKANQHHWSDIPEKVNLMEAVIMEFLNSLPVDRAAWFERELNRPGRPNL
jgi:hypothetical protein